MKLYNLQNKLNVLTETKLKSARGGTSESWLIRQGVGCWFTLRVEGFRRWRLRE